MIKKITSCMVWIILLLGGLNFADNMEILFPSDIKMNGVLGEYNLFFSVDPNQIIVNGSLELYVTYVRPDRYRNSTVSIIINDKPVHSMFLDDLDAAEKAVVIPIDIDNLVEGINVLSIKSYNRISDQICEDNLNPATWLVIDSRSRLKIGYQEKKPNTQMSAYPYPYIKTFTEEKVNFEFLIEESKVDNDILSAMHRMSIDLMKDINIEQFDIKIEAVENLDMVDKNYIFIGHEIPPKMKSMISREVILLPDKVNLFVDIINGKSVLFIISSDTSLLEKGAFYLNDEDARKGSQSGVISLDYFEKNIEKKVFEDEIITLEELGYSSSSSQGSSQMTVEYFVEVPDGWLLQEDAKLELFVRNTEIINEKDATLTVLMNDVPVGSHRLIAQGNELYKIEMYVPKALLSKRAYNIKVKYNLGTELSCDDVMHRDDLWVYTSNTSSFHLPHTINSNVVFSNLRGLFQNSNKKINFAYDHQPDLSEIQVGLKLGIYLSKYMTSPMSYSTSLGDLSDEDNNIVIAKNNKAIIQKINKKMNIPYASDYLSFSTDEGYKLNFFSDEFASGQVYKDKDLLSYNLIITGFKDGSLSRVLNYIISSANSRLLDKDTLFIDHREYAQVFLVNPLMYNTKRDDYVEESIESIGNDNALSRIMENKSVYNYLIFLMGLVIFMAIILIVYLKKKRN